MFCILSTANEAGGRKPEGGVPGRQEGSYLRCTMLAVLSPACAEEHLHHTCTGRGHQPELSPDAGLCEVAEMQQAHQGLALWEKRLGLTVSFPSVLSPGPQGRTYPPAVSL